MSEAVTSATVLIVDDEPLVRMFARDTLDDAGFKIAEASSASEAIRIIGAEQPALLLTDIEMPGTDNGLDLAWSIHANHPSMAIVLTSGRNLPRRSEMPPHARFVAKPYHPGLLLQIVTEALRDRCGHGDCSSSTSDSQD